MADHDSIISTHFFRHSARRREQKIQGYLDDILQDVDENTPIPGTGYHMVFVDRAQTQVVSVPTWARGVRVVPAGNRQWAVQATRTKGH